MSMLICFFVWHLRMVDNRVQLIYKILNRNREGECLLISSLPGKARFADIVIQKVQRHQDLMKAHACEIDKFIRQRAAMQLI